MGDTQNDIKYHYTNWSFPYLFDWNESGSPSKSQSELKATTWDPTKESSSMTNLAFLAMVRWFCDFWTMLTVPFTFLNPVGAVLNVTFLFC